MDKRVSYVASAEKLTNLAFLFMTLGRQMRDADMHINKLREPFFGRLPTKSREGNAKSIGRRFAAPKILGGLECLMLRNLQEPLDCGGLG
jgi:hypothetical protein